MTSRNKNVATPPEPTSRAMRRRRKKGSTATLKSALQAAPTRPRTDGAGRRGAEGSSRYRKIRR